MTRVDDVRAGLRRLQWGGLLIGIFAGVLCAFGASMSMTSFARAWLMAFVLWWEVAIGCLALACIWRMTGGAWGFVSRPFFEAGVRTLPLMALAFVPIALNLDRIYPWHQTGYLAAHEHTENRQLYLEESFFLWRAAGYFAIWMFFGLILTWSRRVDEFGRPVRMLGRAAGLGAAFLLLSASFAAFDWIMSLTPFWHSTMFGALVAIGGVLSGMALVVASVTRILGAPLAPEVSPRQVLNDLGNLLMAFVMVWAYFSFSQYLIIWSGNLPEEAAWYTQRNQGGWEAMAIALGVLHFAVPFVTLLSRDVKRWPNRLGAVAVYLLVIHYVEIFWLIKPVYRERVAVHWLDGVTPIALGGFFLALYGWEAKRRLLPIAHLMIDTRPTAEGERHE